MTWLNVVGLVSAIAMILPITIILLLRLSWYKSFPALLAYYFLVSCYNIISLDFFKANETFVYYLGVANNLLDAPLMLTFMTYFSQTALFRKRMKMLIPAFILFELIVIAVVGFNLNAAIIALGPGLVLVVAFALVFFIHQAKITVVYQKALGKALIAASLLFAYGGYIFIYVVYYLMKSPYKSDTLFVYYLVITFSSFLLTAGIYFERKRVRQLTEIKVAREELRVVYGRS